MMIQRFAVVALVAGLGTSAQATEFNKDALKTMQQQGHQIVEESEDDARQFKAQGDLCLDTSGKDLVVKACAEADSQKWRFDEEDRLVAHTGQCVVGAKLAECAADNARNWKHDDAKRLVNGSGQCLQVQGRTPTAGAKVITAKCGDAANQVWKQAAPAA